MAVINEPINLADLVKYEEECLDYSRNEETIAAGQHLGIGAVVARQSADGKLHALNPSANDGTESAVGILIEDVDATLIDKTGLILARHAVVADKYVVWPAGITAAQKAAAIEQLDVRGILLRTSA
jgi:hypothetical protein